jgi:hypothetical protein
MICLNAAGNAFEAGAGTKICDTYGLFVAWWAGMATAAPRRAVMILPNGMQQEMKR